MAATGGDTHSTRPTTLNLLLYDDDELQEMIGDIFTPDNEMLSPLLMSSSPPLPYAKDPYISSTLHTNNNGSSFNFTNISTGMLVVSTLPDEIPFLPPPPSYSGSVQQEQEQKQQKTMIPYVPHTLQPNNRRYDILPAFPSSFYNDRPPLLLANVPSMSQKSQRSIELVSLFFFFLLHRG
jgi:hypothetical protein